MTPLLSERPSPRPNDGGRWVFETSGEPYPFEVLDAYENRRQADRFTCDMLHEYLRALGVPVDDEPEWAAAFRLEKRA